MRVSHPHGVFAHLTITGNIRDVASSFFQGPLSVGPGECAGDRKRKAAVTVVPITPLATGAAGRRGRVMEAAAESLACIFVNVI